MHHTLHAHDAYIVKSIHRTVCMHDECTMQSMHASMNRILLDMIYARSCYLMVHSPRVGVSVYLAQDEVRIAWGDDLLSPSLDRCCIVVWPQAAGVCPACVRARQCVEGQACAHVEILRG